MPSDCDEFDSCASKADTAYRTPSTAREAIVLLIGMGVVVLETERLPAFGRWHRAALSYISQIDWRYDDYRQKRFTESRPEPARGLSGAGEREERFAGRRAPVSRAAGDERVAGPAAGHP